MNGQYHPRSSAIVRPYFFIALAGILAFAPVSFMLKSLKNDIVAIEYPINYFLSQCMHSGEIPYWFNTWGMGFPLHSSLTWGIFSTPQILFCAIFDYNIYTLHIEFIFFLLMAGWGMYYLLKKYFLHDEKISLVLSICYMLSGFMVGSTQWLLYITAASFLPFAVISLLNLLRTPSFKNALQLAVIYTMMFTSVYAAFNIITTYSFILFVIIFLWQQKSDKKTKLASFNYIALAGIFTLLLCGPCIYYTTELLSYIDRGSAINSNISFFNSNYLHPSALSSMLLPFSSVRMSFPGTEGTMLNTYAGLFVLLLVPGAIAETVKVKNKTAILMFALSLLFLLISFGGITPVRNVFNILPGFSYFRHAAIFRLYFLLSLIIFLATSLRNKSFEELFDFKNNRFAKKNHYFLWLLMTTFITVLFFNVKSFSSLSFISVNGFIKNINLSQTIFISSFIQLVILTAILVTAKTKRFRITKLLLVSDLILNTLVCTPFFSVSSYSLPEVNNILYSKKGFPVQETNINEAAATYTDDKMNRWMNVNIFAKEISYADSYRGPLTLKDFSHFKTDSINAISLFNKKLVFAVDDSIGTVQILLQKPDYVSVKANLTKPTEVILMQNSYPGWKAYYNGQETDLIKNGKTGITISVSKGKAFIEFRYKRTFAWITALLLHLIIISFLLWRIINLIKRKFFTPSFPSSPY